MEAEILEGNKIIAEFMKVDYGGIPIEYDFYTRWDRLMPVVEKIENNGKAHVCMFNKECWIEYYGIHEDLCKFHYKNEVFINNVWLAVAEFIKYFNNENR